jgi:phenylalanyl-tRNA synthetase alpha chain
MLDRITEISNQIENYTAKSAEEVEQFRLQFVARKSLVNDLFEDFKQVH